MSITRFSFPTIIHFGAGARALAGPHLHENGFRRPLIVTDKGLAALPLMNELKARLESVGLAVAVYGGVFGNPTGSQVMNGAAAYKAHDADCVIGIGGGAALDVAKVVGLLATHPGDVMEYVWDHPQVRAISFVGSTPVAKHVYARAAASGKRMQCQGGAKNHVIVLPDADMELATQIIGDSAFGCAGQRCLAVSVAVTVGDAQKTFCDSIGQAASTLRVGDGLGADVQMGPVISRESKQRVESLIAAGIAEGARPVVDGRNAKVANKEAGNFIKPTVLDGLPATSTLTHTEIFGPVLSLVHANSIDEAMDFMHRSPYGNQASLFTTSGAAARKFRYEAPAGNIGINIGVAAPMAYFPFSGWKDSFFGILHGQGRDAVEFYTESKVVVERWSRQETRKF